MCHQAMHNKPMGFRLPQNPDVSSLAVRIQLLWFILPKFQSGLCFRISTRQMWLQVEGIKKKHCPQEKYAYQCRPRDLRVCLALSLMCIVLTFCGCSQLIFFSLLYLSMAGMAQVCLALSTDSFPTGHKNNTLCYCCIRVGGC